MADATIVSTPSVTSILLTNGNNRKRTLIAAAVLGLATLAVIVISMKAKDGTLTVEIDQPDATVQVFDSEGVVKITKKAVHLSESDPPLLRVNGYVHSNSP